MAEWRVDPLNPGEVFACCGIAHLAWLSDGAAETGFTARHDEWTFQGPNAPLDDLAAWALGTTASGLVLGELPLDWWRPWGLNPDLKTWAGQQSAASVHRNLVAAAGTTSPRDWLTVAIPTTGRLNFDIHGTWNALSLGWSPNEHTHLEMLCRPWLELLGSIGLQAFPVLGSRREGFRYHTWQPAPLAAAIAAFQGHGPGVYALAGFEAATDKAGSNTILRKARTLTPGRRILTGRNP